MGRKEVERAFELAGALVVLPWVDDWISQGNGDGFIPDNSGCPIEGWIDNGNWYGDGHGDGDGEGESPTLCIE